MYQLKCTHLPSGDVVGPYDFTDPMAALDCAKELFEDNVKYNHRAIITIKGYNPGLDMDVILDTTFQVQKQHFQQQRNTP